MRTMRSKILSAMITSALMMSMTAYAQTTPPLDVRGDITAEGDIKAEGDINASGKVTAGSGMQVGTVKIVDNGQKGLNVGGSINVTGSISSSGHADIQGNVMAQDIIGRGNLNAGSITTSGSITASKLQVGEVAGTDGNITVKGNITADGNADITGTVTAGDIKVGDTTISTGRIVTEKIGAHEIYCSKLVAHGTADFGKVEAMGIKTYFVTGLINGEISETSNDAVNGRQLYTVQENVKTAQNSADEALQKIANETQDRKTADANLQEQIDMNKDKISQNAQSIAEVNSNLVTAVDTINKNVADGFDTINKNVYDGFATVSGAIDAETTNRIAADNMLSSRIDSVSSRVDKVGAGAAALAALHPLDYDRDNKLSFASGVGNYAGSTAMAIGAFYRPSENCMMSLGGSVGNGENMMSLGVSFAIGKGQSPYASMSKKDLVHKMEQMENRYESVEAENRAMRSELEELKAVVAKLAAKK